MISVSFLEWFFSYFLVILYILNYCKLWFTVKFDLKSQLCLKNFNSKKKESADWKYLLDSRVLFCFNIIVIIFVYLLNVDVYLTIESLHKIILRSTFWVFSLFWPGLSILLLIIHKTNNINFARTIYAKAIKKRLAHKKHQNISKVKIYR